MFTKKSCIGALCAIQLVFFACSNAQSALPGLSAGEIPLADKEFSRDLNKLAKKGGAFGDFFKLKLAEQKLKNGDYKNALKLSLRVSDETLGFWQKVIVAESYLASQNPRQTLALLRDLPRLPEKSLSFGEKTYENLYKRALLARYHAKENLKQNSNADLQLLDALFSNDENLEDFFKKNPVTLSSENKVLKIKRLHEVYRFKQIYSTITLKDIASAKITNDQKCEAYYQLGNGTRMVRGKVEESLLAFEKATEPGCPPDIIAKSLYWYGSLCFRPHNYAKGDKAFVRLYKEFPDHRLADDAIYKLYQRHSKRGETAQANQYYKKLMSLETGDMRDTLVFQIGYDLYEKEKYKKAAEVLSQVLDKKPAPGEALPQAIYWYARSLEKTENKKSLKIAKQTYKDMIQKYPFSFYSILAAKRLDTKIKTPKLPTLQGESPEDTKGYFALVDDFANKGFKNAARAIMDLAIHSNPKWEQTHTNFIAQKFMEAGNYRKSLDMAANFFGTGVYGPVEGSNHPLFSAFYPVAYQKQIQVGYKMSGLPQGSIEGIMREESLFQKNVGSHAGAQGLMQLMPTTAAFVAKKVPDSNLSATNLHDPQNNIKLGSTYLKRMKNYYDEQLPLAIMAYNAGPGNVNKWLKTFGDLPLDEFIEKVPFNETRGYIKRVMRTMLVYGSYYNEDYFTKPAFNFEIQNKFAKILEKNKKRRSRKR